MNQRQGFDLGDRRISRGAAGYSFRSKVQNVAKFKGIELASFTVFVDNLPLSMTSSWLCIFSFQGPVIGVFVSRKKRSTSNFLFAFVRFSNKYEALKAIEKLNGLVIRGSAISVQEAKYGRFTEKEKTMAAPTRNNQWRQKNEVNGERVQEARSYKEVVVE